MANTKRIGWLLLALAALGTLAFVFFQGQPSDEEQIREALRESIQASKEGRPGSVLDLLSREFTLDDQQVPSMREVATYIRDHKPDITIQNWDPVIDGDTALLETPVTLKLGMPFNTSIPLQKVELRFRRERAARWLVFPGSQWRLWRVTTTGFNPGDLMP